MVLGDIPILGDLEMLLVSASKPPRILLIPTVELVRKLSENFSCKHTDLSQPKLFLDCTISRNNSWRNSSVPGWNILSK